MAHEHNHEGHHHNVTGNITIAFLFNAVFALLEFAGGFYFGSVAILSNALHDLGDSLSLAAAWYFQRKSQKKRNDTYTYGYRRFSLIGAFINSVVLIAGSVLIISEAIHRLVEPSQASAKGMLLFALLGIGVNLAAMIRLRKGSTLNERVVSLHFLEDVLGWVAVLIGALIMMYRNIPILDPVLSIGIAIFILYNVYKNMRSLFQIILQGIPVNISEKEIKAQLAGIQGVKDMHDIHLWTLDGNINILTMHVVVGRELQPAGVDAIKDKIKNSLHEINIHHATIETEPENVNCAQNHPDHNTFF